MKRSLGSDHECVGYLDQFPDQFTPGTGYRTQDKVTIDLIVIASSKFTFWLTKKISVIRQLLTLL